jgi:hypothetical protein
MKVKFPDVYVDLMGEDGNAMFIISRVRRALRKGGATDAQVAKFSEEATRGDYDNVLQTCMRWVNCDEEADEDLDD